MKILLCTGIYPPVVGGPANYAYELNRELSALGHEVRIVTYKTERMLPPLVRHLFFFFKILPNTLWAERVVLLDPVSVGLPGYYAAKLFRKKTIFRTGGDFVWESYVERTKHSVTLPDFYKKLPEDLCPKERFFVGWMKKFLGGMTRVIFSTEFQRDIYVRAYGLDMGKTAIVENFYGRRVEEKQMPGEKRFLWAGRNMFLKNTEILEDVFASVKKDHPEVELEMSEHISRDELLSKIRDSYVVIIPSLSEVSPNIILESVMQGTPFICTKHTGVYHRLQGVGLFVDPLSPEDIEAKVRELLTEDGYRKVLENMQRYSYEHSYRDIAREFEEVM